MAIFNNEPHGRVIDANSGSVLRLFGIAAAAFLLVILIFASVARVDSGHVGVLTLFGRVTGRCCPRAFISSIPSRPIMSFPFAPRN